MKVNKIYGEAREGAYLLFSFFFKVGSATAVDWYNFIRDICMVFGGMERGSGESFLVEVARRDAATLLPIIAQHVRPGTTVYSDEWAAYHQLSTATGNVHLTVNHSLHFVDPVTGAHTQGVESMWSSCKRMMREERAMNSLLFDTYLPEFMWRRKFGGPVAFGHILKHISEQYPV